MAWAQPGVVASDATVRDLAKLPVAGTAVKVRISNQFGDAPLQIGAASVAVSVGGANIVGATLRGLTFNHAASTVIPAGQVRYSDAVPFPVHAGQTLAVSLYVRAPDLVTVHPWGTFPVSFATASGGGNQVDASTGGAFPYASDFPRLLDAVDLLEPQGQGSIVVIGDSITDGYNATARWTDLLQKRIDQLPAAQRPAVVNEGITANALSSLPGDDSHTGGGPAGLARLSVDALSQPGVSYVVLFLGTNDLFFGDSASHIISAMRRAIAEAHHAGIKIIGTTLLPRQGSERWDPLQYPTHQPYLDQINRWILTSQAFDGVLNLAAAVADVYNGACDRLAMFPPYDAGDHLHPNDAGQTVMANAVDTRIFGLGPAPALPAPVAVKPTGGCHVP